MGATYLYRYERSWPNYFGGIVTCDIYLNKYPIVKTTDKGVWIHFFGSTRKWVSSSAKKRFAYPTEEQAYLNFQKRTERYINILENSLEIAKASLKAERKQTLELK